MVVGLMVGTLINPLSVFDPGGEACRIDDLADSDASDWSHAGRRRLNEAAYPARQRRTVQCVIVCRHHNEPKRTMP
ncbi:MAG: hypothetical protein CMJ49_04980 [Planctomycetaceae bacterium]|nr:hypothetical protein [Planctomycetaceae bacterium]